jgi:hypothetical protein
LVTLLCHTDIIFIGEDELGTLGLCISLLKEREPSQEFLKYFQNSSDNPQKLIFPFQNLTETILLILIIRIPFIEQEPLAEIRHKVLRDTQKRLSRIHLESVRFFQTMIIPYCLKAIQNFPSNLLLAILRKMLLLDLGGLSAYDPIMNDSIIMTSPGGSITDFRAVLAKGVPVLEDTLSTLIMMIYSKQIPTAESLEIVDSVVRRAAFVAVEEQHQQLLQGHIPALFVKENVIIEALLMLSSFQSPIPVPQNFPKFVFVQFFWDVIAIVILIAAFNPATVGAFCWPNPFLKAIIRLVITRSWGTLDNPTLVAREKEFKVQERQYILNYENDVQSQYSGETVTEANSQLLSQLIVSPIVSGFRLPPTSFIKKLMSMEQDYSLAAKFCACRNPDYLVEIISTEGGEENISSWLGQVVSSHVGTGPSEDMLDVLPPSVLSQALFFTISNRTKVPSKLVYRLLETLFKENLKSHARTNAIVGQLQYFLQKLGPGTDDSRNAAKICVWLLVDIIQGCTPGCSLAVLTEYLEQVLDSWHQKLKDHINTIGFLESLKTLLMPQSGFNDLYLELIAPVFGALCKAIVCETNSQHFVGYSNSWQICTTLPKMPVGPNPGLSAGRE